MWRRRRAGPAIIVAFVVLVAACSGTPWSASLGSVGPFVPDGRNPFQLDTHWHAALGVYDCNHWLGDATGNGIWNWPYATPQGAPARAQDPNLYAGLHSHDDGVIHMEPAVQAEAGRNATVGLYFDYGGWKLSSTGYSFLGTTQDNGDKCGDESGQLEWAVGRWDGTGAEQKLVVKHGDPARYKLYNADIVVIAFVPKNVSADSIGDPPSLPYLERALGFPVIPPSGSLPTTPPATFSS